MAKVVEATDPSIAWATMGHRKALNVFLSGVIVGIVTYALYVVLERFVFDPVLCREGVALARCETKDEFAAGIALLLGSMLGLVLLVRQLVYRPIMAIIGVVIALWGIFSLITLLPWIAALFVVAAVFGVAYLLFSWIVQATSLYISLAVVIVLAVRARLVQNV